MAADSDCVSAGISFILRVRNEEAYLRENLASLKGITVPHEIIIVLHMCTDSSEDIANEALASGQPIRIFKHDVPVSRAGYETLVTPHDHPNSFVTFLKYACSKRRYTWLFRWDGDFSASTELVAYLNTELPLHDTEPCRVVIPCKLGDISNEESYLTNAYCGAGKYCFWEVMLYPPATKQVRIPHPIHSIPIQVLKTYWRLPPWFIGVDKELEDKYAVLVQAFGPEPHGLARASNPECDAIFRAILAKQADLATRGIHVHR